MTHHLVGLTEIGHMLGVSRQRAAQIATDYDDFPAPEAELAAGRVWSCTAVERWIQAHPQRPAGRVEKARAAASGLFEGFTDEARDVVVRAQSEARLLQHAAIGTEHLLLGLLGEPSGRGGAVLRAMGVGADEARARVQEAVGRGGVEPSGQIPFTPRAKACFEFAAQEAQSLGHARVGTEHVLLGLLREGMQPQSRERGGSAGLGPRLLADAGVSLPDLRSAVLDELRGAEPRAEPASAGDARDAGLSSRLDRIDARLATIERLLHRRP